MRGGALFMPRRVLAVARSISTVDARLAACSAFAIVLPVLLWLTELRGPLDHLRGNVPPGQSLYVLSKLAGLVALSLVTLQVALVVSTRLAVIASRLRARVRRLHPILGLFAALAIAGHVLLFAAAATVRAGHTAWSVVGFSFSAGSYEAGRSLGAIGFWTVVVTILAGIMLARHRNHEWLRRLHVLTAGAVFAGAGHAIWIGSEPAFTLSIVGFGAALPVGIRLLTSRQ